MSVLKFDNVSGSVAQAPADVRARFIAKVYNLLFIAMLVMSGFGFYAYKALPLSYFSLFMWAPLGIILISMFTSRVKGLNMVLFMLFALSDGGLLGLLAKVYISAGLGVIFAQAAILTVLVFGALTAYAHVSKKDFSFMGKFLFISLLLLIGAGIVSIFVHSSMLHLAISVGGVAIFSLYVLYDTSRIIHKAHEDEVVFAAWMLFIDIINLFIYILNLLTILSGDN